MNIKWLFRQLLPLTYRSRFVENDKPMFSVWRMWFGKSFDIETYELADTCQ